MQVGVLLSLYTDTGLGWRRRPARVQRLRLRLVSRCLAAPNLLHLTVRDPGHVRAAQLSEPPPPIFPREGGLRVPGAVRTWKSSRGGGLAVPGAYRTKKPGHDFKEHFV